MGSSEPTSKPLLTVVHVVCSVDDRTYIHAMLGIIVLVVTDGELPFRFLCKLLIRSVGGLCHVLLVNDSTLNQPLGLLEVRHGIHHFGVGWDGCFLEIKLFRTNVLVNPCCMN